MEDARYQTIDARLQTEDFWAARSNHPGFPASSAPKSYFDTFDKLSASPASLILVLYFDFAQHGAAHQPGDFKWNKI